MRVVVRRIENKLGIHGSPTCELQFNDTPAQLVGKGSKGPGSVIAVSDFWFFG